MSKFYRYIWITLLAIFTSQALLTSVFAYYERPYISYAFSSPHDARRLPLVIAHKAKVPELPPNTLEGIEVIMQSDVGGIEIDIQLSKDGIPVVFHDDLLEEMTTGEGPVSAYTAAELKNMRYILDGVTTPYTIPTLREVFERVKNEKVLFLDIKDAKLKDTGMARAVAALVKEYHLYQTVIVETFNPLFLYKMRKNDAQIMVQFDYVEDATPTEEESPEQLASIPWLLKQPFFHWLMRNAAVPDLLGVRFSNDQQRIRYLSDHGYPIIAWTIDDTAKAVELLEAGVMGIQTNRPFEMLEDLKQLFPTEEYDAGGIDNAQVDRVIDVANEQDIAQALESARKENKKISLAGAQHTMGGHTFSNGSIVLKMYKYNQMSYSPESQRLNVQSGATWSQVQEYLDQFDRSVVVMQSDTIFSIGGSLSANVHGWQVGKAPLASTVQQFRLMLANGEIVVCSRETNAELFKAVLGGYGLFGVILDVELETFPNRMLIKESSYFPAEKYAENYLKKVSLKPDVELAYGRFSVAHDQLLQEASLNTFRLAPEPAPAVEPLVQESMISIKRNIFRLSERTDKGKQLRWIAEKNLSKWIEQKYQSRNNAMHPDIHVLWPQLVDKRDTLQEYFIPKEHYQAFIDALRKRVLEYDVNLLNVTVREVLTDQDTFLAYARQDSFAFVLLFSQGIENPDEENMKAFTQQVIDDVLAMDGTFYLPYRLYYRFDQFSQAYPMYQDFMDLKRQYDPDERFSSQFWEYISEKD